MEYSGRRNRVMRKSAGIPGVEPIVPEAGLFVMADVRRLGRPSDMIRRYLLAKYGVVVIHGSAYGPGGEGFLRVSFAGGGETLKHSLERLRADSCSLQANNQLEMTLAPSHADNLAALPVIDRRPRCPGSTRGRCTRHSWIP